MNRVLLVLVTLAAVRLLSPDFPFGNADREPRGGFFNRFAHSFAMLTVRLAPDVRLLFDDRGDGRSDDLLVVHLRNPVRFDQGRTTHAVVYSLAMVLGCATAGLLGLGSARAVVPFG